MRVLDHARDAGGGQAARTRPWRRLLLATAVALLASVALIVNRAAEASSESGGSDDGAVAELNGGATPTAQAVRLTPPEPRNEEPPPPVGSGINGLPFAPPGLTGCAEFRFYADQFGLPAYFDGLAWRESNCRNEDGVRTFCCHGYLQLYVSQHLADHRLGPRYRNICGVHSHHDVNSDEPLDKQRQVCAAKQLYDVTPGAWS